MLEISLQRQGRLTQVAHGAELQHALSENKMQGLAKKEEGITVVEDEIIDVRGE